jgi:hypothetical protein
LKTQTKFFKNRSFGKEKSEQPKRQLCFSLTVQVFLSYFSLQRFHSLLISLCVKPKQKGNGCPILIIVQQIEDPYKPFQSKNKQRTTDRHRLNRFQEPEPERFELLQVFVKENV